MHIYHASWGSFPPAYLADESGKPKHSWRVLLLPYLPAWDGDLKSLYEAYDFSEPWDGPNNRQFVEQMPRVYRCPLEQEQSDESTSYVVVTGVESAFNGRRSVKLNEIGDGLDATILVAEVGGSGINWMEPRDVSLDQAVPAGDPSRSLAAKATHTVGFGLGFADGEVSFIPREVDRKKLKAGFTINGGEPASVPTLMFVGAKRDRDAEFKLTNTGIRALYFYGSGRGPGAFDLQRLTAKGWSYVGWVCGTGGIPCFKVASGGTFNSSVYHAPNDTRPFRVGAGYATSRSDLVPDNGGVVWSVPVLIGTTGFVSKQGITVNMEFTAQP